MSENVYWVLKLTIQPGQNKAFEALVQEMTEGAKAESGTLAFDWSIGADDVTYYVFEHYKDSASTLLHLENLSNTYASRLVPMITPVQFDLFGAPTAAVQEGLSGFGSVYYKPLEGFIR